MRAPGVALYKAGRRAYHARGGTSLMNITGDAGTSGVALQQRNGMQERMLMWGSVTC